MSNNVLIHFDYGEFSKDFTWKSKGRIYGLLFKNTSVEEISLATLKASICKKVGLNENMVKLKLSYIPLLVGSHVPVEVIDDEDVSCYLEAMDKEQRRCVLYVEVIEQCCEQVSKVGRGSSFGVNYEINASAIVPYVGPEQAEQEHEGKEDETEPLDESMDDGVDSLAMHDEYVETSHDVQGSQFMEAWEDGTGMKIGQEFRNKEAVQDLVDRAAFQNCFSYTVKKSDKVRLVLHCRQGSCKWRLQAAKVGKTDYFSVRTYNTMHTCSRASSSTSNGKRKGTPELVASVLHEDYPGQMHLSTAKSLIPLVNGKFGVKVSYSTALRGIKKAVSDLRGSPEESYKMLYCYLYMLEKVNHGTVTKVNLDGGKKFKYLFIALGASIEGFKAMRKVITVDATFLKNGYGGVLVFAAAQDPNSHHYPIAFVVLDGENYPSWTWFFDSLKSVVPDSSELVFISDRNASLIKAISEVYLSAHHGYCIWHLSQNVKGHVANVNKDVVAWRFMECCKVYTEAEFVRVYGDFRFIYHSAAKYLDETADVKHCARCYFPGERYNIFTSNYAESLNSVFGRCQKYSLLPMIDAITVKMSEWFNKHRKDACSGSEHHKLVPYVENIVHNTCKDAVVLTLTELNSFELEYAVNGSDGKTYLVNLNRKSCSCRCFDIDKYPCVHATAAVVEYMKREDRERDIFFHDLCSRYYSVELWALAYWRMIYLVPDKSEWNVPDDIKELEVIPPNCIKKMGRKWLKRFPSVGERRKRTNNKRVPGRNLEYWLFGNTSSV